MRRFHNWTDQQFRAEFHAVSMDAAERRGLVRGLRRHRTSGLFALAGGAGIILVSGPVGWVFAALGMYGFAEQLRVSARAHAEELRLKRELAELEARLIALEDEARHRGYRLP